VRLAGGRSDGTAEGGDEMTGVSGGSGAPPAPARSSSPHAAAAAQIAISAIVLSTRTQTQRCSTRAVTRGSRAEGDPGRVVHRMGA
jgi:hypothetical protein